MGASARSSPATIIELADSPMQLEIQVSASPLISPLVHRVALAPTQVAADASLILFELSIRAVTIHGRES